MYRFLLSRRWLALLILLVVFVVACVELGLWQLRRLDERKKLNAVISTNLRLPAVPVDAAFGSGEPNEALYRHVTASGKFDISQEVLLTGRAVNNRPGSDVLTPLVTPSGRALIVNRGFVPFGIDEPGDSRALPPASTVTVTGILLPSEGRGLFGQAVPTTGHVDKIPRVDVSRIGRQVPYAVFPAYLLQATQQPPQSGSLPQPEEYLPQLSNGPHLGYVIQWFSFAAVALVAFGAAVWRRARAGDRTVSTSPDPQRLA